MRLFSMKNILSFLPGTPILGSDIRIWFEFHTKNKTSHTREATFMKNHYNNINDNNYYQIVLSHESSGCGEVVRHKPLIKKYGVGSSIG